MAKAKTETKDKVRTEGVAQPAQNAGAVVPAEDNAAPRGLRLRVPYPPAWGERNGVTQDAWRILQDSAWPNAKTAEAICLAFGYCRWRNLDPLKKMVHIVPIWDKNLETTDDRGNPKRGGWSEGVWPGIAEIRVTATRTGVYAGKDEMKFGPDKTRVFKGEREVWKDRQKVKEKYDLELTYPEWAELTVYRIVQGVRCAFVGPKVMWEEAYATESRWSEAPNEMWADRKQGQLDKCAEAAALRSAFPEELGGEYAAEEMWGRVMESAPVRQIPAPKDEPLKEGEVRPPVPSTSEFARQDQPKTEAAKPTPVKTETGGDPRGDIPPVGEEVERKEGATPTAEQEGPTSAELDAILVKARARLQNPMTAGKLVDLRDEIEQELPPESSHLAAWIKDCEVRMEEIVKGGKKK